MNCGREPAFAQRFHANDGVDRKIYAIGGRLYGVKKIFPRRTEDEKRGEPFVLSPELREIALRCGRAFGLDLYGVDVIESGGIPYVVDMCSIPGFKGVPDAPHLLAQYFYAAAERAARGELGPMPMPRHKILEVLTEGVGEHRAVQAWLQLQSDSWEPGSLEVLQRRRYSTVYRLNHATQHRMGVIAKRCRTARARLERFILGELLPRTGMPVLACYGLLEDPDGDFCWLFLEDAAGCFYSPQLPDHRALAGYWLAEIQLTTAAADFKSLLPNRELDYYLQLLRNCQAIVHSLYGTPLSAEDTALRFKLAHTLNSTRMERLAGPCWVARERGLFRESPRCLTVIRESGGEQAATRIQRKASKWRRGSRGPRPGFALPAAVTQQDPGRRGPQQ